jgi:hypothetical protein
VAVSASLATLMPVETTLAVPVLREPRPEQPVEFVGEQRVDRRVRPGLHERLAERVRNRDAGDFERRAAAGVDRVPEVDGRGRGWLRRWRGRIAPRGDVRFVIPALDEQLLQAVAIPLPPRSRTSALRKDPQL